MNELRIHLKQLEKVYPKLDGYLLGFKHGITLADLDHQYEAHVKEIEDMRILLREKNGKTGRAKDHQGD